MKKINIFVIVTATILLLAACVSATAEELVYLKVDNVTTSSFDETPDWAPLPEPMAVVEGDLLTRWSSGYADNQWVSLDFGLPKVLTKLVIFWETAYAVDYDILGSDDNENRQVILSLKDQDGGVDQVELAPTKVRYVRVLGKRRFNPEWGISMWEILCLGPASENPQDEPLSIVYPKLAHQLKGEKAQKVKLDLEEPVVSPGAITSKEFQKGVVYTSWGRQELGTEASDKTL